MNRTRRLLALTGDALAVRGIATWLPDLPGTGDAGGTMDWATWRAVVAELAATCDGVVGVRGGALLLDGPRRAAAVAPVSGAVLIRDLLRSRVLADSERGRKTTQKELLASESCELAGYRLDRALRDALTSALIPDVPNIACTAAPWLQAEPRADREAADALAALIAAWMTS
jgi:hypothetical protein